MKTISSFVLIVTCCIHCSSGSKSSSIVISKTDQGVLVKEGNAPILFYQQKPISLPDGTFTRNNYVHPLYGLDGEILTEDFPKDHFHQRGIYWAWHQLWVGEERVGNSWEISDFSWDIDSVQVIPINSKSAALKTHLYWKSDLYKDEKAKQKPIVEETNIIRVYEAADNMRKIDFEIRLLALITDVRLAGSPNKKGYGGFSVRMRLPEGIQFLGQKGNLELIVNQVQAGPWVDIAGSLGLEGKTCGIAILCHPSIPIFPPGWLLRRKNSMQNPAYPGEQPVLLSTEKPVILRYRLIIHQGKLDGGEIDSLQEEYNREGYRSCSVE